MMTLAEILEQAQALSVSERKELAKMLIDSLSVEELRSPAITTGGVAEHWGQSLNHLLDEIGPIEFVDAHLEDPVAWVKEQRRKEAAQLDPYLDQADD
ncbi:MAG: hypothetical protein JXA10_13705 [Anaerolineae bacterium]|nr:hypothetical protein [Anaerolineae bacterium]